MGVRPTFGTFLISDNLKGDDSFFWGGGGEVEVGTFEKKLYLKLNLAVFFKIYYFFNLIL